jgi:hypothetical protein
MYKPGQIVTIKSDEHGQHPYRVKKCDGFKCVTCDLKKKRQYILDLTYIEETPLVCGWDANICFDKMGFNQNFKKL